MSVAHDPSQHSRLDISKFLEGCDQMLLQDLSPYQRRMMLVYKQHASLEITGRWQEIFDPRLMVPEPEYVYVSPNKYHELHGAKAVQWFYDAISQAKSSVRMIEQEEIAFSQSGFMSEALYRIFLRGDTARKYGHDGVDPEGFYVETRWSMVNWRFDSSARLVGERVYPASTGELHQIPEASFWTTEEAHEVLHAEIEARWSVFEN